MAQEKQNGKKQFNEDSPAWQAQAAQLPPAAELSIDTDIRESKRSAKKARIIIGTGTLALLAVTGYNMLKAPDNPDHRPEKAIIAADSITRPFDCELGSFKLDSKDAAAVRYQAVVNISLRPGVAEAEQAMLQDPSVSWGAPQLMIRQAQPGESLEQLAAKPVSADVAQEGYKQVGTASGERIVNIAMSRDMPVATRAELLYIRPVETMDDEHRYETTEPIHCGFLEQTTDGLRQIQYDQPISSQPNTLMLPLNK